MNWPVETLLTVHIIVVTVFLAFVALILIRRGLFRWNTAGFWAWASFALYYVLNPLFALRNNNLYLYELHLAIAGGTERGLWILFVLLLGMTFFFIAYLRTSVKKAARRLKNDRISMPALLSVLPFLGLGIYSLVSQRALIVDTGREKIIDGGRFTGQVSGYEDAGYLFLVVPILMLISSHNRGSRIAGWLAAGLFLLLTLPNGWARFAIISMLIAVSLIDSLQRQAAWPRWIFLPILLIFVLALQLHGHTASDLYSIVDEMMDVTNEIMQNVVDSIGNAIGSQEVSALATWYLESYVTEQYTGYTYGLPLINYALTGWIPGRIFPQKYFLVDWLKARNSRYLSVYLDRLLYGAKSTLFGSFYQTGGLLGVLLMAFLAGFLSRKLDGMVNSEAPLLVRTTGAAWMSILWMIWQSSDSWVLTNMGILAMPALAMWIFSSRRSSEKFTRNTQLRQRRVV